MGIIRFALKSTVAGGLVYYTVQEGLWSTPEDSLKVYCRIYNGVAPYIQKNIPQDIAKEIAVSQQFSNMCHITLRETAANDPEVEIPDLPNVSTMIGCSRGMWNKGVMSSIKFISELPTHVSNGIDYVMSTPAIKDSVSNVKGLFDAQPEAKKSQ